MKRPVFTFIVATFWAAQVLPVGAVNSDDSYQPLPEGVIRFLDGTSPGSFELALDQVWVRPSGKRAFVEAIEPLASNADLYNFVSAREAATPGDVCGMVAYLAGKPRNDSTIRFVTRKVSVRFKEDFRTIEHANAIALELGLGHEREQISISGWTVFRLSNSADSIPTAKLVHDHPKVLSAHAMIGFRAATKACETASSPVFFPNDPEWAEDPFGAMLIPNVWQNDDGFGNPFLFRPYAGFGREVAVSDDGVDWRHQDLIDNTSRTAQFNFIGGGVDPSGGFHGTQVAGILYAEGGNGFCISGVLPKARGAGIRWDVGITDDENVTRVLGHKAYKFDVHNASWGMPDGSLVASSPGPETMDELKSQSRGVTPLPYVFQSGNGNLNNVADEDGNVVTDLSTYDGFANSIYTIAVAPANGRIDFPGEQDGITAEPGSNIVCTALVPGTTTVPDDGCEGIDPFSSFAAPVVSGIVALMTEARLESGLERLGWRDYQEILIASGSGGGRFNSGIPGPFSDFPYDWSHGIEASGYGLVNAGLAVLFAEYWPKLPDSGLDYRTVKRSKRPRDDIDGLESYTFDFTKVMNLRIEHAQVRLRWAPDSSSEPAIVRLYCPNGLFSWELAPYWSELSGAGKLTGDLAAGTFVDLPEDYTFTSVGHWGQLSAGTPVAADPFGLATHDGLWRVDVGGANGRKLDRIDVIFHGTEPNTPSQIASADVIGSGDPTLLNPGRITDSEDLIVTNFEIIDPEYQDPTLIYQWQRLHPDGVTWNNLPGAEGVVRGSCDWVPVADFTVAPVTPRQDVMAQFSSTSRDPGGELISWEWDFGDGTTSSEENPRHTFSAGSVPFTTVTLTVTDNTGNTDTFSRFITILEPDEAAPNPQPVVFPNLGDGICFYDGEVILPAGKIAAENAYRVIIRPNDGKRDGVPRVFPAVPDGGGDGFVLSTFVAANSTPVTEARPDEPYVYDVDLWITSVPPAEFPDFFKVNEVSQGVLGNQSNGEWVELLTVVTSDMRGYHLTNNIASFDLTFTEAGLWSAIPAGTLIVIYNSDYRDGVLPPDDFDLSDGVIVIGSSNQNYFVLPSNGDRWGEVSNVNPSHIALLNRYCRIIDGVSWNGDKAYLDLEDLRDGQSAHSSSTDLAGYETLGNWVVGTAAEPPSGTPVPPEPATEGTTPGLINDTNNALVSADIIAQGLTSIPTYSLVDPAPAWLSIDPGTGLLAGTPSAIDAGVVTVTVFRSHSFATEFQTFNIIVAPKVLPPLEDEDEDGIINIFEVAFGTDPLTVNSGESPLPTVSQGSITGVVPGVPSTNHMAITFRRMKGGTMDFGTMAYTWVSLSGDTYLYEVESSSDLDTWTSAGDQPGQLFQDSVSDAPDDPDNVELATFRMFLTTENELSKFLRVSLTINP